MPGPTTAPTARPKVWPAAVLVGLFLAAAIPVIFFGGLPGRPGWDQHNYHEPIIRTFADTWPRADASNYLSATTPLYHWVLAPVAIVSDSRFVLQLAGSLFTVALLALLARACVRALPERPGLTLLICLPFGASMFVFPAGVWLLPDNAGWLGVLVVWLLAMQPGWTNARTVTTALVLVLLVLSRQIHIWAAAVIWTAAWLGPVDDAAEPGLGPTILPAGVFLARPDRFRRTMLAFVLTLPAFAVVIAFRVLWGGLIVPRFQGFYSGWGPTTPDFGLTLFAVYSVFFAGWLAPGAADLIRRHWKALVVAAVVGLIAAVYPVSTYSLEEGRYGGLWNIARIAPVIADRSVVMIAGAPVGAAALVLWLGSIGARDRVLMLAAFVAFEAAQCACSMTWQRYSEPMLLMFVILAAVRTPAARTFGSQPLVIRAAMVAGPAVLALFFAALTASVVIRGDDASTLPRDPLTSPDYWGPPEPKPAEYTEGPLPGGP